LIPRAETASKVYNKMNIKGEEGAVGLVVGYSSIPSQGNVPGPPFSRIRSYMRVLTSITSCRVFLCDFFIERGYWALF
jgi:hypothetical protein